MGQVLFSHPNKAVGNLAIDNGVDSAQWGYGLNTATFPTFGGEVVQILSVYIDDLTLVGTLSTYKQMEAIYSYFTSYLQVSSQGRSVTPVGSADTTTGSAYNLQPMTFSYPDRGWQFQIYPTAVPGFRYGREVVTPTWQVTCHIIDDSPDLDLIKDGIKALATSSLVNGESFNLNGEISPQFGNPDTDPFETYTSGIAAQQQQISQYADYYNSLIPAYMQGDFSALTAGVGSTPNFGQTSSGATGSNVTLPGATAPAGSALSNGGLGNLG